MTSFNLEIPNRPVTPAKEDLDGSSQEKKAAQPQGGLQALQALEGERMLRAASQGAAQAPGASGGSE